MRAYCAADVVRSTRFKKSAEMLLALVVGGGCLFVFALPLLNKSENAEEALLRRARAFACLLTKKSENAAKVCASSRTVAVLLELGTPGTRPTGMRRTWARVAWGGFDLAK